MVSDDDEDDGGNDDDDCAPNRPERSALLLLLLPLFNFAAFDEDRGEDPLLPWSGGVAGRMLSPPMLILLLLFLLPAVVLTAVVALLDFFKTCISSRKYAVLPSYFCIRHKKTPINIAPSLFCPI